MALFDRSALNPGVRGREVFAWSMYDFANSGYTTVVLTAVFNAYFVGVVAGNAAWATFAWTAALALSSLLVIFTAPAIGARGDLHGDKKTMLAVVTAVCVVATAALGLIGPGEIAFALGLIIVSNYCYVIGDMLIAAFLPELARPAALGKVSGWGWSFGYFGGMLTLGLSLAWVLSAQKAGAGATEFVPVTMWITAAVYGLAAIPVFLILRERAGGKPGNPGAPALAVAMTPLTRIRHYWQRVRGFDDFVRLLYCGFFYQAGIAVVIALAAVYAEQAMNFTQVETMSLIFLVNIASALGAFGFGYLQDRIGHRAALGLTLVGWIVMSLLAAIADDRATFWAAAGLAGLCMGSSQSAGRAIVGLLAPARRVAEFYGMWALATRVSAIVGPLTYGIVTWVTTGNHRLAILVTGSFFVIGLLILARIDIDRGRAAGLACVD